MSAQPLNTNISIYLTVRAQRNKRTHDSVGTVIKHQRPLVMSTPNRELPSVEVDAYDTSSKDFSVWGRNGIPVVEGQHGSLAFADAQAHLPNIDFAFTIGGDKFLTNTAAGLSGDLQSDLRTVEATYEENSPTI